MNSPTEKDKIIAIKYEKSTNQFFINDDPNPIFSSPLGLDSEYKPIDYTLYYLNNKRAEIGENSIYQIYDNKINERIGWVFPIQALISKEHDYFENIHFLKYAYIATYKIIEQIASSSNFTIDDIIRLEQEDDQKIILVLCNKQCSKIDGFSIDDYVISLYNQGYTFSGEGNLRPESILLEKRLNLKRISDVLTDEVFIIDLYKHILPSDLLHYARFHMLYQIIEILIGKVFKYEFEEVLGKVADENLFELKEKLSDMLNEKRRIAVLITKYSKIDSDKSQQCNEDCIELLSSVRKDIKSDFSSNLYAVRCVVFHGYSSIPKDKRGLLDDINTSFEAVLSDILLTFRLDTSP